MTAMMNELLVLLLGIMRSACLGEYSINLDGVGTAATRVSPVTCPILVWGANDS